MDNKTPITILLVEDDEYLLSLYAGKFATNNFKVYSARDGLQAVNIYNQYHPQVVLTDLDLPEMRGDDVLRIIDRDTAGAKPLCVVLSNYDQDIAEVGGQLPEIVAGYFVKINTTPAEVVEAVISLYRKNKKMS